MREEYKLIFLTLLVRLGLGTLFVYIVTSFWAPSAHEYIIAFIGLSVTTAGLALSLLHIGRPVRILNTFSNRRSAMSWEAIIAPPLLLAISALVGCSYLHPTSIWNTVLKVVVMLLSVAFIFVTGKVYHLRARPSWSTPLVLYEYFTSAAIMGLLGYSLVLVESGNMTDFSAKVFGYLLSVLIVAELIITYSFRFRAIQVTVTARKALVENIATKQLYTQFVVLGLLIPAGLSLALALGVKSSTVVPIALGTFLLGAIWWRILFFRSATLIKITPDVAI